MTKFKTFESCKSIPYNLFQKRDFLFTALHVGIEQDYNTWAALRPFQRWEFIYAFQDYAVIASQLIICAITSVCKYSTITDPLQYGSIYMEKSLIELFEKAAFLFNLSPNPLVDLL